MSQPVFARYASRMIYPADGLPSGTVLVIRPEGIVTTLTNMQPTEDMLMRAVAISGAPSGSHHPAIIVPAQWFGDLSSVEGFNVHQAARSSSRIHGREK